MNGRELAEQVQQAWRDIPVLYMSGYSDDAILRSGIQAASAHFIQKPFSMETLMAKMRETMTGRPGYPAGGAPSVEAL